MKMHHSIAILFVLGLTSCSTPGTHVAVQPSLPCDNTALDNDYLAALRGADEFFLLGPGGQDSMQFASYRILVRVLADSSTRDQVLTSFYYRGTVEAKAFCLFGLHAIRAPVYTTLRKNFLALPAATYVIHHKGCRILKQTPEEIVHQIETERLWSERLLRRVESLSDAK